MAHQGAERPPQAGSARLGARVLNVTADGLPSAQIERDGGTGQRCQAPLGGCSTSPPQELDTEQ